MRTQHTEVTMDRATQEKLSCLYGRKERLIAEMRRLDAEIGSKTKERVYRAGQISLVENEIKILEPEAAEGKRGDIRPLCDLDDVPLDDFDQRFVAWEDMH